MQNLNTGKQLRQQQQQQHHYSFIALAMVFVGVSTETGCQQQRWLNHTKHFRMRNVETTKGNPNFACYDLTASRRQAKIGFGWGNAEQGNLIRARSNELRKTADFARFVSSKPIVAVGQWPFLVASPMLLFRFCYVAISQLTSSFGMRAILGSTTH